MLKKKITKQRKRKTKNKQTNKQKTMNFGARSLSMVIADENYLKTLSSLAEGYKSFIIDYYRLKMSFF